MASRRPRLLFLITEDWYFWSHRLDLARAMRDAGMEVLVATRVQDHGVRITQEGFRILPIRLLRSSRNPLRELSAIHELVGLYRSQKPDIVHHVAMKPILYGSMAARWARVPCVVNAFAGLGYTYIAKGLGARLMRRLMGLGLKRALARSNSMAVFQNDEDCEQMVRDGVLPAGQARVIRGSGVDVNAFSPSEETTNEPIVMLASRMLWDKGVGEFVEASRLTKEKGVKSRFVLVGRSDSDNPASISPIQLRAWHDQGLVEWWGHRDDMPKVLNSSAIVVLPSYREGLPKVLLEAAACGKAIVATDVPGCREIVRHDINGLVVPPKDSLALAQAILRLLEDAALRGQMGVRGRDIAVREFAIGKVVEETLGVYGELLGTSGLSGLLPGAA